MKNFIFPLLLLFANHSDALTLATEDYPPFNFVDSKTGKITGMATDKIVVMMQRAKIDYQIGIYPWTRAIQMAQQSPDTCVFSMVRNSERESAYRWVGPLGKNNWVIYGRSSNPVTPKSLDDIRNNVIGVYRNSAIGTYLQQQRFKLDWANYDSENPRKLTFGRFDYWASGEVMGQYHIALSDLQGQIIPLFTFNSAQMYLACNVLVPQKTIDLLNQTLKEMDRDGTSAAISRKYKNND